MPESIKSFVYAESQGVAWLRRPPQPEDDHLMAHTLNWLSALPKGVRPVKLPKAFPRIANDLCRLWPTTAGLAHYFEDKKSSPREARQGFPPLVREELLAMHIYSLRNRPRSKAPYQLQLPPS